MGASGVADQIKYLVFDVVIRALGDAAKRPEVTSFFDEPTNTASHIVADPASRCCGVTDSVLDYDAASGRTATRSADQLIAFIRKHGLEVEWILETHVHADHLSAAPYIKQRLGGALGIGENVRVVQDIFGKVLNAATEFRRDDSQFDHLFIAGERFGVSEEDFVRMRTSRDAHLGMPKLILPSVQVNMRAGEFPPAEADGQTYLKIPLNQL